MAQINFARREIGCKIVYYGPGMCGKTTNLEMVYKKVPESNKGNMTSIATEGDRTLFFDFLPVDLGQIGGLGVKLQLYTVPGQVYYNSTRRLVLQGVDGVVFVADSQSSKEQENLESLLNLEENLKSYGFDMASVPLVIQFNKRDLPDIMDVVKMRAVLNKYNAPDFEAVAFKGEGVFPTLKSISKLVIEKVQKEYLPSNQTPVRPLKVETAPAAPIASGPAVTVNPPSAKTEIITPASPVPAQSFGTDQDGKTSAGPSVNSGVSLPNPSVLPSAKPLRSPVAPVVSPSAVSSGPNRQAEPPVRVENKPAFSSDKVGASPALSTGKSGASHVFSTGKSGASQPVAVTKTALEPTGQKEVAPLPKQVDAPIKSGPVTLSGPGEIKPPFSKMTEPAARPSAPRSVPDYDKMQLNQKEFPLVWVVVIIALVVLSLICLIVFTR